MKQIISDYLLLLLLGINESSSQSALATDHEVESAAESDQVRGSHADRFIIITRPLEHINIGKIMILRRVHYSAAASSLSLELLRTHLLFS